MIEYRITQEFHTMPAVAFKGRPGHSVDFFYAIRRTADDSLVFRAETSGFADLLLERLYIFQKQAA